MMMPTLPLPLLSPPTSSSSSSSFSSVLLRLGVGGACRGPAGVEERVEAFILASTVAVGAVVTLLPSLRAVVVSAVLPGQLPQRTGHSRATTELDKASKQSSTVSEGIHQAPSLFAAHAPAALVAVPMAVAVAVVAADVIVGVSVAVSVAVAVTKTNALAMDAAVVVDVVIVGVAVVIVAAALAGIGSLHLIPWYPAWQTHPQTAWFASVTTATDSVIRSRRPVYIHTPWCLLLERQR